MHIVTNEISVKWLWLQWKSNVYTTSIQSRVIFLRHESALCSYKGGRHTLDLGDIFHTDISQGSVATRLRFAGICSDLLLKI